VRSQNFPNRKASPNPIPKRNRIFPNPDPQAHPIPNRKPKSLFQTSWWGTFVIVLSKHIHT